MKPGLVLSDDQCNKRFGMKKDETIQDKDESKKSDDKTTEDINHRVVENEYAVLIDAEKSFDEQVKIGKPLFVSLLTRGTVSTVEEDDKDEDDEVVADTCSTLISDTLAMMISFQTERQLANARKFLPIKNILSEQGRVKIEDTLNILIQQIVLLMKQNKHFKSLSIEDQSELCQVDKLKFEKNSHYIILNDVLGECDGLHCSLMFQCLLSQDQHHLLAWNPSNQHQSQQHHHLP